MEYIQESMGELWNERKRIYKTIEALGSKNEQRNMAKEAEAETKMGVKELYF